MRNTNSKETIVKVLRETKMDFFQKMDVTNVNEKVF